MLILLNILEVIYSLIARSRNFLYKRQIFKSHSISIPIICVGNISSGGNGKTPLVLYLAEKLQAKGYKPIVLSRGYKGTVVCPYLVNDSDTASRVGDEPLLIHQHHIPVMVDPNRVRGANYILSNNLGDLIIMDDGLQHQRLSRDLNMLSVDCSTLDSQKAFIEGKLLPAGRFREDRTEALKRSQIIVLSSRSSSKELELYDEICDTFSPTLKVHTSFLTVEAFVSLSGAGSLDNNSVIALCGIANPIGFYETIQSAGYKIVKKHCLVDHQPISENILNSLRREFPNTPIICTEKDAVKLKSMNVDNIYYLKVGYQISDEEQFLDYVKDCIT